MVRSFAFQAQVCFILCATFAFAVLQNVTVDDSASSGAAIPTYLPSPSYWNQGNTCTGCLAKPDPAQAYDGTWHDSTFSPDNTYSQAIQFSFVGSGLYIFFILANTVQYATTLTNVTFFLDEVQMSSFTHDPSTSTAYEYNQTVYANSSIPYGQHTMVVVPASNGLNNTLILFDYYVYTTESSDVTTTSAGTSGTSPSASPASPSGVAATSGPNIGAVVGGTVGGVAFVLVAGVVAWRYKKRAKQHPLNAVEPFVPSSEMAPTSLSGGSPPTKPVSSHVRTQSELSLAVQPSNLPSSNSPLTQASSSALPSGENTETLVAQVGMLRTEVARLRHLQDLAWDPSEIRSELPPEYS